MVAFTIINFPIRHVAQIVLGALDTHSIWFHSSVESFVCAFFFLSFVMCMWGWGVFIRARATLNSICRRWTSSPSPISNVVLMSFFFPLHYLVVVSLFSVCRWCDKVGCVCTAQAILQTLNEERSASSKGIKLCWSCAVDDDGVVQTARLCSNRNWIGQLAIQ